MRTYGWACGGFLKFALLEGRICVGVSTCVFNRRYHAHPHVAGSGVAFLQQLQLSSVSRCCCCSIFFVETTSLVQDKNQQKRRAKRWPNSPSDSALSAGILYRTIYRNLIENYDIEHFDNLLNCFFSWIHLHNLLSPITTSQGEKNSWDFIQTYLSLLKRVKVK